MWIELIEPKAIGSYTTWIETITCSETITSSSLQKRTLCSSYTNSPKAISHWAVLNANANRYH